MINLIANPQVKKVEKKQYSEALAMTGTIKCTFHPKVWEVFKPWSCIRPLCTFSLEIKSTSHFFLQCHLYNESRLSIFTDLRKVDENFKNIPMNSSFYPLLHSWSNPSLPLIKGRVEFLKFLRKGGEGSDFSHKRGVVDKGSCFKKGGISYFYTN